MSNTKESKESNSSLLQTVELDAEKWVGWLRDDIKKFQGMSGIDVDRAIRGLIVGLIAGDAINAFVGAKMIAESAGIDSDDNRLYVIGGLKMSWLQCTKAIEEFGDLLPLKCRQAFKDVFDQYRPFIEKVVERGELDPEEVIRETRDLYEAIGSLYRGSGPLGVSEKDIDYSLMVIVPSYMNYISPELTSNGVGQF